MKVSDGKRREWRSSFIASYFIRYWYVQQVSYISLPYLFRPWYECARRASLDEAGRIMEYKNWPEAVRPDRKSRAMIKDRDSMPSCNDNCLAPFQELGLRGGSEQRCSFGALNCPIKIELEVPLMLSDRERERG